MQHQLPSAVAAKSLQLAVSSTGDDVRAGTSGLFDRSLAVAAIRQDPGADSQPAMATDKPTTGGWMAHKSENGQVNVLYYLLCQRLRATQHA